jgi:hypothetical protein
VKGIIVLKESHPTQSLDKEDHSKVSLKDLGTGTLEWFHLRRRSREGRD